MLASLALTSGCAVDGIGLVAGQVYRADGAVVTRVHVLGGHLRTLDGDAGASLGYGRRTYVHALHPASDAPRTGWHVFAVPLPEEPWVAVHARSVGLALDTLGGRISGTAGLIDSTVVRAPDGDAGGIVHLDLQPSAPVHTTLTACLGPEVPCPD